MKTPDYNSYIKRKLEEACFIDKKITEQLYPEEDYHTLYIAGIEKILLKD